MFLNQLKYSKKAWSYLGLLVLGTFILVPQVEAQSRDVESRISRMENEIKTLSKAIFRGEQPPPGAFSSGNDAAATASFEIRIQQMETELRTMRGLVEQQGFEVDQLKKELARVTGDLELRLGDLEKGGAAPASRSGLDITTKSSSSDEPPQPEARSSEGGGGYKWNSGAGANGAASQKGQLGSYTESPESGEIKGGNDLAAATYENAFSLVKNNQYDAAEKEFLVFLDQYPNHVLAGNAKYWLGETYYVRGKFEQAARLFAEGYQQFPQGSKAADNLLKLGMSLAAMDKKDDACIALSQIGKEGFPNAGPAVRRADQEKTRLGCSS